MDVPNSTQSRSDSPTLWLRPRQTTGTIQNVGRVRLIADLKPIEVTFLLLAFVSIVGAGIITAVRLKESEKLSPDFTFALLLLINLVFILVYIVHGIFRERPFEILVSVAATVIVMLYCIVEYAIKGRHDAGENRDLKLGRLIVVCFLGPVDVTLGLIIAKGFYESRNLIFQTVGGNSALQSMCQTMFMFTAVLKFDFQIVVSLLILVIENSTGDMPLVEKLVLGIGVPLTLFWCILGFVLGRYENLKLCFVFWAFSIAEPAYIIWLFVRTANEMNGSADKFYDSASLVPDVDAILNACVISAGVLGLICRVAVVILSVLVARNFGKGLKEKVYMDSDPLDSDAVPSIPSSYSATGETR